MAIQRVLVVDDESSLRSALFRALNKKYQVITACNVAEAIELSKIDLNLDLALIDLKLPDGDGIELMSHLQKYHPNIKSIILTGHGTVEKAVEATHKGASHFITKPFNLEEVLSISDNLISQKKLEIENCQLKASLQNKYKFDNIIGQGEKISQVLKLVDKVATTDSTVLITGESGTGKELIARALHFNSHRSQAPFVPINCGAIPSELLESELFGHVKGAFTNAVNNRAGRFELAEGGTIFFDEIGDMSPHLQVKLLRVLQDRKFEPIGSTKTKTANVRIIAATNLDLENAVKKGKFREDLFYRLNVIPVTLPSLRERKTDMPILFQYFMENFNRKNSTEIKGISPEALNILTHYTWPGNVRELENLVERLSIIKGSGIIDTYDLPPKYKSQSNFSFNSDKIEIPDTGLDYNSAVNAYENQLILKALEKTGWNRNQAAILLKINRTTLVEKIKKKGLKQKEI